MNGWGDVLLVLLAGGALSWLSRHLSFPNAVAQVLLGVALGSAVLGWVTPVPALGVLGEIAVVLLLGVAGIEIGFEHLRKAGGAGVTVAALGIVLSVAGGYAVARAWGSVSVEALYLGLALGATSVGITVQVLEQYHLVGHRVADIVVAAAVIDDVVALLMLGAAHGVLTGTQGATGLLGFFLLSSVVLVAIFTVSRSATHRLWGQGRLRDAWWRTLWLLAAIGSGAWITHTFGLSSVVGAFFAGLGAGDGIGDSHREQSVRSLEPAVLILMPFFFVTIGLQARWDVLAEPSMLALAGVLTAVAVLSKALGGVVGALELRRWRDRFIVGFGMVPRGEVGLVIATLGYTQGHLSHHVFMVLVFTTIAVSVLGPLMMMPFARSLAAQRARAAAGEDRQLA